MSFRFSAVEKNVISDIFNTERLQADIPDIGDTLRGAAHLRDLVHEANIVGEFTRKNGFTSGRNFQRVGAIDSNIMLALDQLHAAMCDCHKPIWGPRGHKEFFLQWLALPEGAPFDVRGKVVV